MVFLHPVHNFALVAYDPSVLGVAAASVIRAAELLPGRFDSGMSFSRVILQIFNCEIFSNLSDIILLILCINV